MADNFIVSINVNEDGIIKWTKEKFTDCADLFLFFWLRKTQTGSNGFELFPYKFPYEF